MKDKKYFRVFLLFFAFLFFTSVFLSGCAEMEPDTIHQLKLQVKKLDKRTGKLTRAVTQSDAYLGQKIHNIQVNVANQGVKISGVNSKLRGIYGKYEEESHSLHMLQKRFKEYRLIVNRELVKLLNAVKIKSSLKKIKEPVPAEKIKEPVPAEKKVTQTSPGHADFNKGMDLYKNKDYAAAAAFFSKLISKYPQSEDAPDALFYKAMSNFNLKKYPVSILEFHKFSELYPKNTHTSVAIYLQGMGFLKLSDKSDASILFRQVISKYHNTRASKLSAKELKKLSK